jgi:hypothetical protein
MSRQFPGLPTESLISVLSADLACRLVELSPKPFPEGPPRLGRDHEDGSDDLRPFPVPTASSGCNVRGEKGLSGKIYLLSAAYCGLRKLKKCNDSVPRRGRATELSDRKDITVTYIKQDSAVGAIDDPVKESACDRYYRIFEFPQANNGITNRPEPFSIQRNPARNIFSDQVPGANRNTHLSECETAPTSPVSVTASIRIIART